MQMTRFRQRLLIVTALASAANYSEIALGDDAEVAQRVCTVIDSMGSTIKCAVNESEHAVDLTADTSAVDAMYLCTSSSEMAQVLTTTLSGKWRMRVFSDQDGDSPAAVCDLG